MKHCGDKKISDNVSSWYNCNRPRFISHNLFEHHMCHNFDRFISHDLFRHKMFHVTIIVSRSQSFQTSHVSCSHLSHVGTCRLEGEGCQGMGAEEVMTIMMIMIIIMMVIITMTVKRWWWTWWLWVQRRQVSLTRPKSIFWMHLICKRALLVSQLRNIQLFNYFLSKYMIYYWFTGFPPRSTGALLETLS